MKMSENTENNSVEETYTKHYYRKIVWENLEKNNLVNFPRPCYYRIPNFKGCEEAAMKLVQLDEFKNAQNIEINPDKPQEPVRFYVLEEDKNLYVPVPRLANGLLKHIALGENPVKEDIKRAVNRKGIENLGKDVGLADDVSIDLVVLGSVAVSKEGYRIGKGKGFADLEFGILYQMGAVNQNTVVITTVHDSQVFDKLPPELFQAHDVPVDIIVTPTEVIYVENKLRKPEGIIWDILSHRRIDLMPVLKTLREIDEKAGKDVTLKEVDTDVENQEPRRRFRRYYRFSRHRRLTDKNSENKTSESQPEDTVQDVKKKPSQPRRRYNRKPRTPKSSEGKENINSDVENIKPNEKPKSRRNIRKKQIDFTLMVRNIEKSMRVRDMKGALAERGVKPGLITWRGSKGYCCLHFAKNKLANEADHNVDNVIGMLQNLKLNSHASKQLSIEVMKPISRIETTDVTSV